MNRRKLTRSRLAAALVVAIGVGTVWGIALLWIGYFAMQFSQKEQVRESINVLRDGTPVIESRSSANWLDVTYRTLDGRPIEVDPERTLPGASFSPPVKPPGLYETAVPWPSRIAGLSDYQRPPASWYLMRDAEPLGRAYFVGYDQFSKLPIGYIAGGGFSRATPPLDQWFDVGRHRLDWGGVIAATGQIEFGSAAYSYGYSISLEDRRIPPWNSYLIDGNRLLEIDLRARTLRPLYESPGLLATAIMYEIVGKSDEPVAAPADSAPAASVPATSVPAAIAPAPLPMASFRATGTFIAISGAPSKQELQPRVAVRTTERIVVIDPPTGKKREFKLPPATRDMHLSAYPLTSGELFLIWLKDNDRVRNEMELAWIGPDGSIARQQVVALARNEDPEERVAAWLAMPVAPIPAGWATVLGLVAPVGMLQDYKAASYVDALAQGLSFAGLPFLVVILIGALLAWLTLRLQRKYRRPASGVWMAFVFLCGLPGFLAYLIEHRRPKLETCPKCGEIVPRDRDACAACDTEFPPPPLVGTEIFA